MSAPAIAAFDLAKNFGDTHALQGLDLQVEEARLLVASVLTGRARRR